MYNRPIARTKNKELTLGDFTEEDFKELDELMNEINL